MGSGKAVRSGGPTSVRIAQTAKLAGVSVPTVSKALDGRPGVPGESRSRVEELINEYGYRKPSDHKQKFVELIFRELEDERLKAKGIPCVVFDPVDDVPEGAPYIGATNLNGGQSATRHRVLGEDAHHGGRHRPQIDGGRGNNLLHPEQTDATVPNHRDLSPLDVPYLEPFQ